MQVAQLCPGVAGDDLDPGPWSQYGWPLTQLSRGVRLSALRPDRGWTAARRGSGGPSWVVERERQSVSARAMSAPGTLAGV